MIRPTSWVALAALFCVSVPASGLGPHECALLVNGNSGDSMALANFYAALRRIPPANIIHLDLPERALEAGASFTVEEFRDLIYEPAMNTIRARQLQGHVLTWIYSVDFPSIISTVPPMSLTGLTFTHGIPPPGDAIRQGTWLSPLFQGPDRADGPTAPSSTFENFSMRHQTNMPLPSMLLGWSGSRGMTLEEIKSQLEISAAADGTQPEAGVYFEVNDNVRSTTRGWQFEPAHRTLAGSTLEVVAGSSAPVADSLMGVMAGRASLQARDYGTLKAGAYADHLTSFGALFHDPDQTKLTEWLRNGAAGSAGTVVEPGSLEVPVSLWAKFPAARFFEHYVSGCTMIESLFQSTRSPLQILFVGDPLCQPWARPPMLALINMADNPDAPIRGRAEFISSSLGPPGDSTSLNLFLLNGRPVVQSGQSNRLILDSLRIHDGYHEIRAVSYVGNPVRQQGLALSSFITRNKAQGAQLGGYTSGQSADLSKPLEFTISADGKPMDAAVLAQERILARAPYEDGMTLSIDPLQVGAGPVSFQAAVVYAGGMAVRSPPLSLVLTRSSPPPLVHPPVASTNREGKVSLSARAEGIAGEQVTRMWLFNLLATGNGEASTIPDTLQGAVQPSGNGILVASTGRVVISTFSIDQPNRMLEIRGQFRFMEGTSVSAGHQSGIVFNYLDQDNYMAWGADGTLSAWKLIRVQDGREQVLLTRGKPLKPGKDYTLSVRSLDSMTMGLVVDDEVLAKASCSFGPGRVGMLAGTSPVLFESLMVSPPSAAQVLFSEQGDDLALPPDYEKSLKAIWRAAQNRPGTTVMVPAVNPAAP